MRILGISKTSRSAEDIPEDNNLECLSFCCSTSVSEVLEGLQGQQRSLQHISPFRVFLERLRCVGCNCPPSHCFASQRKEGQKHHHRDSTWSRGFSERIRLLLGKLHNFANSELTRSEPIPKIGFSKGRVQNF